MGVVRHESPFRGQTTAIVAAINQNYYQARHQAIGPAGLGNGTTAGNLRTQASTDYRVGDQLKTLSATDNVWDLSGETDTGAAEFRAYWLYVDASGTASIAAGTNASTFNAAVQALPAIDTDQGVIGVFVAGNSCDFDAGGGLQSQGTVLDGIPSIFFEFAAPITLV